MPSLNQTLVLMLITFLSLLSGCIHVLSLLHKGFIYYTKKTNCFFEIPFESPRFNLFAMILEISL